MYNSKSEQEMQLALSVLPYTKNPDIPSANCAKYKLATVKVIKKFERIFTKNYFSSQ